MEFFDQSFQLIYGFALTDATIRACRVGPTHLSPPYVSFHRRLIRKWTVSPGIPLIPFNIAQIRETS